MNINYITRNFHVLSLIGDFKLFHSYIINREVFSKEKKYHFDLVNLPSDDKLKLLADCIYELSMFKNKLKTTNESFKDLEDIDFQDMYVDILEIVSFLKPYVSESNFLHEMKIKNYFRAVFDDSVRMSIKPKTKDHVILTLLDYFYSKDKEYEAKANFYIASDNKTKPKKHYTEEIWFIVGLEFANGSIYKNNKIAKDESDLARIVFGNTKHQPYINQTLSDTNNQKNIYQRTKAKQELKIIYDHCIEKNIIIHPKFEEQYLIAQSKK